MLEEQAHHRQVFVAHGDDQHSGEVVLKVFLVGVLVKVDVEVTLGGPVSVGAVLAQQLGRPRDVARPDHIHPV